MKVRLNNKGNSQQNRQLPNGLESKRLKHTEISVEDEDNEDEELLFDTDLKPSPEMSANRFQEQMESEMDEIIEVTKVGLISKVQFQCYHSY